MSRNYPNNVLPLLGLWVEGIVRCSTRFCAPVVVSPVPYCPALPLLPETSRRFRGVESHRRHNGVEVYHPRFLSLPGRALLDLESTTYYRGVIGTVEKLRPAFAFEAIHAHMSYPDGYVAARLGQRYGVPVIITEHAPWLPWLEHHALARRQVIWAARQCTFHIAVSAAVRDTIRHFTGESRKLEVIPCGVDGSLFTIAQDETLPDPLQLLFVGAIRPVKGVDVLLRAVRLLADRGRAFKLVLVGESFYASYRREYDRMRRLAQDLDLARQVEFVGGRPQVEVVRYMQQSALLVLPSRLESLGMVLVEALACGTPVVATRSGGPEDIVTDDVGVLVAPGDPEALARGIEHVVRQRSTYNPQKLRAHALGKFGLETITQRIVDLYFKAAGRPA